MKKEMTSREIKRAKKNHHRKLTAHQREQLIYNTVAYRLAKARDKWGLIAIITFSCLLISLYFNFKAYWPI